jgi:hypothetical protein
MKLFVLVSILFFNLESQGQVTQDGLDSRINSVEIQNAYQAPDGSDVIQFKYKSHSPYENSINPDFMETGLTFFCKEDSCYQMDAQTEGWATIDDFSLRFQDFRFSEDGLPIFSAHPKTGTYKLDCGENRQGDFSQLSGVDKMELQNKIREHKIKLLPLTEWQRPHLLLKIKGTDDYIYITYNKYYFGDSPDRGYHMYIGPKGNMKELKIIKVNEGTIGHNGGSFTTSDGKILINSDSPTWDGKPIEELGSGSAINNFLKVADVPKVATKRPILHTPCDKFFPEAPKADGSGSIVTGK